MENIYQKFSKDTISISELQHTVGGGQVQSIGQQRSMIDRYGKVNANLNSDYSVSNFSGPRGHRLTGITKHNDGYDVSVGTDIGGTMGGNPNVGVSITSFCDIF